MDGARLTFEVYGFWRRNMLMRDAQTGTIWQHATGAALDGPLKGRQLEMIYTQEMTWGALREAHPQASYIRGPERETGILPAHVILRLLPLTERLRLPGLTADHRLDPHEQVIGVAVGGEARAYPLASLRALGQVRDVLGGQEIVLEYEPAADRVTLHDASGTRLPCERQWWLAWSEFHPRSGIYGK